MYYGSTYRSTSRVPWLRLLVVAGLLSGLAAWTWTQNAPVAAPITALQACDGTPESVIIIEDNSGSVEGLDPDDRRIEAIEAIIAELALAPCTPVDYLSVLSFTDVVAQTGPAPAAGFPVIARAAGGGTDIANAVDAAIDLAANRPGDRHVVILVSDLEEGGSIPAELTLDRLAAAFDPVIVSIGAAAPTSGITQIQLAEASEISNRIVDEINNSRKASS